ncbi:NAD-dependent glutamate dehydrogenase [Streptomyces sp. TLI_171]|nr:NAD-dependent glutamate dehydrogenase [Streptomyces sp. TLI_171]
MQTKLDAAKADLLRKAAAAAENSQVGGAAPGEGLSNGALAAYLHHYYLHTAPEDVISRDPVDLYGAAASHYRLGLKRPQGTAEVRVSTPTVEENGWSCGHTVVEVVTDDMPFLVDSVTNELTRLDRAIHLVVHPQLAVRRDITGKLLEILDVDACNRAQAAGAEWPADAVVESWMHIEIDRETDREDLRTIEANLRRVLGDVREVVEDWSKMRDSALRLADELAEEPPRTCPSRRSARPGS